MAELSDDEIRILHKDLLQLKTDLQQQLKLGQATADIVTLDQQAIGRVSRIDAIQQQKMAQSSQRKNELRLRQVLRALKALGPVNK